MANRVLQVPCEADLTVACAHALNYVDSVGVDCVDLSCISPTVDADVSRSSKII